MRFYPARRTNVASFFYQTKYIAELYLAQDGFVHSYMTSN